MLAYLSLLGIFLSVIMLIYNGRRYTSSIYLGAFFLIVSLYGLGQYVLLYSHSVFWVSIFYTNFAFLYYLIGPLLFWYIRSILTDNSRLKVIDLLHLLPMGIYIIAALPFMFSSFAYKVGIAERIVADVGFLGIYQATVLSTLFSNVIVYLSRPLLILFYTFWSIALFFRYIKFESEQHVVFQQRFMIKWLIVLLGFHLILTVSHAFLLYDSFTPNQPSPFFSVNTMLIISVVGMTGLLFSLFFFPSILYGLPRLPESILNQKEEDHEKTSMLQFDRMCDPKYDAKYIDLIEAKTEQTMQEHQPYLQPDFNLIQFAVLVQIPYHHLAYFFREVKQQSFSDYRNFWRVKHARELIRNGKASELTLEAIGMQSGFSSRNTFFTAFKKVEGVPPSAFVDKSSDSL